MINYQHYDLKFLMGGGLVDLAKQAPRKRLPGGIASTPIRTLNSHLREGGRWGLRVEEVEGKEMEKLGQMWYMSMLIEILRVGTGS